ncbi:hypothetical protein C8J57DRAFT_1228031 [Mycena rebaudengoi]|nr:hypothetical protein C8J57DRAFT_1251925 [Mycena rebaudengoi]KAJ7268317.1 hypothetical protein C8J57DRAFT_1228031 [Mycena rebaudengoi]
MNGWNLNFGTKMRKTRHRRLSRGDWIGVWIVTKPDVLDRDCERSPMRFERGTSAGTGAGTGLPPGTAEDSGRGGTLGVDGCIESVAMAEAMELETSAGSATSVSLFDYKGQLLSAQWGKAPMKS